MTFQDSSSTAPSDERYQEKSMKSAASRRNDYFEQPQVWDRPVSPDDERRAEKIVEMIPSDVKTILDVGCGAGIITNRLVRDYEVTGLDASREALRHVEGTAVHGDAENLPFPAASFDLVLCSSLLEHLPDDSYRKVCSELVRVSGKYVIISVPYKERLRSGQTICWNCFSRFNVWGHLRSFDEHAILDAFDGDLETCRTELTSGRMSSKPSLSRGLSRFAGLESFTYAVCPRCGRKQHDKPNLSLALAFLMKLSDKTLLIFQRPKEFQGTATHINILFSRTC